MFCLIQFCNLSITLTIIISLKLKRLKCSMVDENMRKFSFKSSNWLLCLASIALLNSSKFCWVSSTASKGFFTLPLAFDLGLTDAQKKALEQMMLMASAKLQWYGRRGAPFGKPVIYHVTLCEVFFVKQPLVLYKQVIEK